MSCSVLHYSLFTINASSVTLELYSVLDDAAATLLLSKTGFFFHSAFVTEVGVDLNCLLPTHVQTKTLMVIFGICSSSDHFWFLQWSNGTRRSYS